MVFAGSYFHANAITELLQIVGDRIPNSRNPNPATRRVNPICVERILDRRVLG